MQTVGTPPTDAATCDARALALELAGVRQRHWLDPMAIGVVLRPEEAAFRVIVASFAIRLDGQWSGREPVSVVITSERLLVRFAAGDLASLWWAVSWVWRSMLNAVGWCSTTLTGCRAPFSGQRSM